MSKYSFPPVTCLLGMLAAFALPLPAHAANSSMEGMDDMPGMDMSEGMDIPCLFYTSPSPRDLCETRMPAPA